MNLYFTYESRDTPKSLILFIAVKTITKIWETAITLKQKFKNFAVVARVLQTMQNLVISRCCFPDNGKEKCEGS